MKKNLLTVIVLFLSLILSPTIQAKKKKPKGFINTKEIVIVDSSNLQNVATDMITSLVKSPLPLVHVKAETYMLVEDSCKGISFGTPGNLGGGFGGGGMGGGGIPGFPSGGSNSKKTAANCGMISKKNLIRFMFDGMFFDPKDNKFKIDLPKNLFTLNFFKDLKASVDQKDPLHAANLFRITLGQRKDMGKKGIKFFPENWVSFGVLPSISVPSTASAKSLMSTARAQITLSLGHIQESAIVPLIKRGIASKPEPINKRPPWERKSLIHFR